MSSRREYRESGVTTTRRRPSRCEPSSSPACRGGTSGLVRLVVEQRVRRQTGNVDRCAGCDSLLSSRLPASGSSEREREERPLVVQLVRPDPRPCPCSVSRLGVEHAPGWSTAPSEVKNSTVIARVGTLQFFHQRLLGGIEKRTVPGFARSEYGARRWSGQTGKRPRRIGVGVSRRRQRSRRRRATPGTGRSCRRGSVTRAAPDGGRLEAEGQRLVPAALQLQRRLVVGIRTDDDDHLVQSLGGQTRAGQVAAVLPPQHLVQVVELVTAAVP